MNATSMKVRALLLGLGAVCAVALQGCVVDPDELDDEDSDSEVAEVQVVAAGDTVSEARPAGSEAVGAATVKVETVRVVKPASAAPGLRLPEGQKAGQKERKRMTTARSGANAGEDPPPEPW